MVTVKQDTWLPAQTALVEVISDSDGLFVCTSERVDAWPRAVKAGLNKIRCMVREESAPITLRAGELIGEVVTLGQQRGRNKQTA